MRTFSKKCQRQIYFLVRQQQQLVELQAPFLVLNQSEQPQLFHETQKTLIFPKTTVSYLLDPLQNFRPHALRQQPHQQLRPVKNSISINLVRKEYHLKQSSLMTVVMHLQIYRYFQLTVHRPTM